MSADNPEKPPAPFDFRAWTSDTRALTLSTKGAWIDILAALWFAPTRGRLTQSLTQWARAVSANPDQTTKALHELRDQQVAVVVWTDERHIEVINRRMVRAAYPRTHDARSVSAGRSNAERVAALRRRRRAGCGRQSCEDCPPETQERHCRLSPVTPGNGVTGCNGDVTGCNGDVTAAVTSLNPKVSRVGRKSVTACNGDVTAGNVTPPLQPLQRPPNNVMRGRTGARALRSSYLTNNHNPYPPLPPRDSEAAGAAKAGGGGGEEIKIINREPPPPATAPTTRQSPAKARGGAPSEAPPASVTPPDTDAWRAWKRLFGVELAALGLTTPERFAALNAERGPDAPPAHVMAAILDLNEREAGGSPSKFRRGRIGHIVNDGVSTAALNRVNNAIRTVTRMEREQRTRATPQVTSPVVADADPGGKLVCPKCGFVVDNPSRLAVDIAAAPEKPKPFLRHLAHCPECDSRLRHEPGE